MKMKMKINFIVLLGLNILIFIPLLTTAFPKFPSLPQGSLNINADAIKHRSSAAASGSVCPFGGGDQNRGLKPRNLDIDIDINSRAEIRSDGDSQAQQLTFNPAKQKISTSGVHRFIPPGPKDLRGPCPGLNALANHGYLSRDGVTNWIQASTAATEVFGLGEDLSTVMSLLAVILSGNILTMEWSIGGPPPLSLFGSIGSILLGKPQGISGSHNRYETDASAFKGDSYLFNGDHISTRLDYFATFLNTTTTGEYNDIPLWRALRRVRTDHSIANNPYFYLGPFSGLIATEAGIFFPPIMFSNHSEAAPGGTLTKEVLYAWYSIRENAATGELEYIPGFERIPENWYRQPTNSLTTLRLLTLIIELIAEYPPAGNIGGNTGTVDSFVGVDLADLTGGVFNAIDLLNPEKLFCFVFGLLFALLPDFLLGALTKLGLGIAMNLLKTLLGSSFAGCPSFVLDPTLLEQFPGAGKGPKLRL
ncbi:hypothetical protein DFH27DRAFT_276120 [Peziza echinospora]|nr:hypothetical protein DFH27DRAFT_276120 [Peziza echinospora]